MIPAMYLFSSHYLFKGKRCREIYDVATQSHKRICNKYAQIHHILSRIFDFLSMMHHLKEQHILFTITPK